MANQIDAIPVLLLLPLAQDAVNSLVNCNCMYSAYLLVRLLSPLAACPHVRQQPVTQRCNCLFVCQERSAWCLHTALAEHAVHNRLMRPGSAGARCERCKQPGLLQLLLFVLPAGVAAPDAFTQHLQITLSTSTQCTQASLLLALKSTLQTAWSIAAYLLVLLRLAPSRSTCGSRCPHPPSAPSPRCCWR
jgi:hypothetical protein